MTSARLASEIWVSALRKRLESQAIPIFVIQKGDKVAGAIIIRVSDLRGRSKVFLQAPSVTGDRRWVKHASGLDVDIEAILEEQKRFDQDLWILEVEEPHDIHFLNKFLLPI